MLRDFAKGRQKNRRGSPSERFETVKLVFQYVFCMDEISQIHDLCEQRQEFLKRLASDCREMEMLVREPGRIAASTGPKKEWVIQDLENAIEILQKPLDQLPRLLKDLKSSLDVVSHPVYGHSLQL